MEKNTYLRSDDRNRAVAVRGGRALATMLFILAVICGAGSGSRTIEAVSQPSYAIASFPAGGSPSAAKIGDLDGDGLNDIAVVNLPGNLQLFFNNGNGSFTRISREGLWPSSSSTRDLDIGDLNGDGRNDLAVAFSTQNGSVSVLLNQGNRTFSSPVNHDVCNSSRGVAIGDLDQDGDNDLSAISECSRAGILLNDAHGVFALNGTYGEGSHSKSIRLGDFNQDGRKDIAYVNTGAGIHGSITLLLNNGNGTFGAPSLFYAGDLPDDVAIGDFDGDGTADLAIANPYFGQVILLFGNGTGDFVGYSELTNVDTPSSIAATDLNADGRMDIVVSSWTVSRLAILINQGDYNFVNAGNFDVGQNPSCVAVGNLDGDSLPDLVAVNQGSGSLTVFFSAITAPPPPPPPPPPAPITLTVSTRTTSKARLVDLRWSGATGSTVDVYRNGSRLTGAPNTGSYTDQFGRHARGTFRYKICIQSGQQCSNEVAISF